MSLIFWFLVVKWKWTRSESSQMMPKSANYLIYLLQALQPTQSVILLGFRNEKEKAKVVLHKKPNFPFFTTETSILVKKLAACLSVLEKKWAKRWSSEMVKIVKKLDFVSKFDFTQHHTNDHLK